MTTRPELQLGGHLWRGLGAVALFGVLVAVTLGANFPSPAGFPNVDSITATIGFAMFGIESQGVRATGTEPFLVAFETIDVVLVAALVAAVMLARRESGGEVVSALLRRGGEE